MPSLFDPLVVGDITLSNRIVMAPLTRMRSFDQRTPGPLNLEHYVQRASAGLIISEATAIRPDGVGYPKTPGIWSEGQIVGWSKITSAVHEAGGKIMCQLWHVGRISDPYYLNGELPIAPSAIRAGGYVSMIRPQRPFMVPREIDVAEIPEIVADFRRAAENALLAGFDGVELHAANGYLLDQFMHDGSNHRTDLYGGSIRNRVRLVLDLVDALIKVWAPGRVGVHLNLMSSSHSMEDSDPLALFSYVAAQLSERKIAFIFCRETLDGSRRRISPIVRRIFSGSFIANDGFDFESASEVVRNGDADAVAFGRSYIANPDLVKRFQCGANLNPLIMDSIYGHGDHGYNDYPMLED